LEQLLADDTAGDPCSPLKWKHKSLRRLSDSLGATHPASPPTVTRLLDELGFARHVNRKTLATSSPERDAQFEYLLAQKRAFLTQGWPVIHVDTKKRELIGCFKNPGTQWSREPQPVNLYDFRSLADGIAIP
jgi:Rhodopirellula transposase DDE domain